MRDYRNPDRDTRNEKSTANGRSYDREIARTRQPSRFLLHEENGITAVRRQFKNTLFSFTQLI